MDLGQWKLSYSEGSLKGVIVRRVVSAARLAAVVSILIPLLAERYVKQCLELDNSLMQSVGLPPVHLDASIVNDILAELVLKLLLDLRAIERHGVFVWVKRFLLGEVVRISLGLQDLVGCVDLGLSIARV